MARDTARVLRRPAGIATHSSGRFVKTIARLLLDWQAALHDEHVIVSMPMAEMTQLQERLLQEDTPTQRIARGAHSMSKATKYVQIMRCMPMVVIYS
jgi:hypothetical protein